MRGYIGHISVIVFMVVFCFLFASCAPETDGTGAENNRSVKVCVEDSPYYSVETNVIRAERGEDVTIVLRFTDGFSYRDCSYDDCLVSEGTEYTKIVLRKVLYSCRVKIETSVADAVICYYLNGGEFIAEEEKGESFLRYCDLSHHLRANTSLGTDICRREGYVQIGWNMKADGSGEHIGLGSRVTVEKDKPLELYAEWVKCIDAECFSYRAEPGGVVLTGYTGERRMDRFVLPNEIEGIPVVGIAEGFAENIEGNALVLPHTVTEVQGGAFVDCSFEEIYFFDALTDVTDDSFGGMRFKTWHINAVLPPVYQGITDNVQFAENMDRLILNADRKKLIFFAGCSMSYGLKSEEIDAVYGEEYFVMNMGVIGGTNTSFQFDCIQKFLGAGDVVVHAPEVASIYQMMYSSAAESRIFMLVEGNYDLLSYAHTEEISNLFQCWAQYNAGRTEMEDGSYTDYRESYNEYGDYAVERPFSGRDVSYSDGRYFYCTEYITDASVGALCDKYDDMRDRGAEVYFSFSPVNYNGLPEEQLRSREWEIFEEAYRSRLTQRDYQTISTAYDYVFLGRYFYDTDYHLNDEGALLRTQRLLRDLQQVL